MNLLAIDTATDSCSVAITFNGHLFAQNEIIPREHADRILGMVDSLLTKAGATLSELDAIVYGAGPGAFTGVRIAVSVAQGLAFGADLPLIPVSTLWALAQGYYRKNPDMDQVLVAVDARMEEVYTGGYVAEGAVLLPVGEEMLLAPDQMLLPDERFAAGFAAVGSAWRNYAAKIPASVWERSQAIETEILPEAQDLLPLGEYVYGVHGGCLPENAQPNYLRNEVAKKPASASKGAR